MSKQLKYRVWDIARKKLSYPEQEKYKPTDDHWNHIAGYYLLNQMGVLFCNDGIMLDDWHDSFIITESIGLKDKNGKEIYDGDIVDNVNGYKGNKVYYDEKSASFRYGLGWTFQYPEKLEVVGNIFQNSKLLNEESKDN